MSIEHESKVKEAAYSSSLAVIYNKLSLSIYDKGWDGLVNTRRSVRKPKKNFFIFQNPAETSKTNAKRQEFKSKTSVGILRQGIPLYSF